MVLESIITPRNAKRVPWTLFFIGILYSSIALIISWNIFYNQAGLVTVFLTVLACAHLMYLTVKREEKTDTCTPNESRILCEHGKSLLFLMMLFLGISISLAAWYIFVPEETSSDLFDVQIQTLNGIRSDTAGKATGSGFFTYILTHNIKVMVYCFIAGLLYGLGAIFILVWNASVIGVAIGQFFKSKIHIYAASLGFHKIAGFFHVTGWSIMRYFFHGFWEILAYFVAGLAGGIISIAWARHHFTTKSGERILLDASNLLLIALGILFIAAFIEVYVTPLLF